MACRNAEAHVADAVQSVFGQRGVECELIVVDGASSDNTVEVIQSAVEGWTQGRCVVVSEPDDGLYDALNKGVQRATGDVIGLLHADDMLAAPDVLKRVATELEQSGADGCYGDLQYVQRAHPDRVVRHWRSGPYARRRLRWGWMPPHPTLYLRREVYDRARLPDGCYFDTAYQCSADYEFMLRILWQHAVGLAYLPEVMVQMRMGGISNRSLKHLWRKSAEDYCILRRHHVGGLAALLAKNLRKLPQFISQ